MKKQSITNPENTDFELTNEIALAWVDAERRKGTAKAAIEDCLKTKAGKQTLADAGEQLFKRYGKRERIKGTQDFTESTPFDTFNTQVQQSSKDQGQKLKPACDNEGNWKLVEVKSKAPREKAKTSKSLDEIRTAYVELMKDRTVEEREGELVLLRSLLDLPAQQSADVTRISPAKKKRGKKVSTKVA
jgi:hypothetical protein